MIFRRLPKHLQNVANYLVLAASISLLAITADAGNTEAQSDVAGTADGNGIIHVDGKGIKPDQSQC